MDFNTYHLIVISSILLIVWPGGKQTIPIKLMSLAWGKQTISINQMSLAWG
jgi:hypothetical protein